MFKRNGNRPPATLAHCCACGADFVHPVEWSPHDDERWWMLLRCGGCGAWSEETVPDADADVFDGELDRAQESIRRSAERLNRERLVELVSAFATALELDLISAEDFARSR